MVSQPRYHVLLQKLKGGKLKQVEQQELYYIMYGISMAHSEILKSKGVTPPKDFEM